MGETDQSNSFSQWVFADVIHSCVTPNLSSSCRFSYVFGPIGESARSFLKWSSFSSSIFTLNGVGLAVAAVGRVVKGAMIVRLRRFSRN